MLILSIDTTSNAGSVAVSEHTTLLGCVQTSSAESHSVRLFAAIQFLIEQLKIPLSRFDAYAVTTGPGSFAGLRIGVAAVKGLAEMFQKPAVPVSTLEAVAGTAGVISGNERIVAVLDARRSEVYAGTYVCSGDHLVCVEPDCLVKADLFFGAQPETPCRFVGPEVDKFSSFVTPRSSWGWSLVKTTWFLAPQVAKVASQKIQKAGMLPSDQLSIRYIRRSDAEMMFKV